MKKGLALLVAASMTAATLMGCSSQGANDGAKDTQAVGGEEKEGSYSIAGNIWGTGAYPLDIIIHADEKVAAIADVKFDVADNQFTADKIISDLQNQLSTKPDAVLMFSVVDAVFGNVQELCDAQKVPYALDTNFPSDPEVWEQIKNDPLFIGGIAASPYEMGKEIAELALSNGNKTAVLLGAAIGDYSHDQRMAGFKDTFTAGGGEVLQEMHCSDPSESTTKANDLMTANPDVDCVYATGGDYLSALSAIKAGDSAASYMVYGTDVAPDLLDYIESGVITAMNGGNHVNGAVAMTLLINYLDGHQILDADGKAPVLDYFKTYLITKDNVAGFQKLYANESCFFTDDEFKTLLYKFNPDVNIETYEQFLNTAADVIYAKAEAAK